MKYIEEFNAKKRTIQEAVSLVKSGDRISVGYAGAVANALTEALYERREELEDITICVSNVSKLSQLYTTTEMEPFHFVSPFLGDGERIAMKNGRDVQFTSLHLSQTALWFREIAKANVAFLEVSPPNEEGYMSYGVSGISMQSYAVEGAELIIANVNPRMPFIDGMDATIHISKVDAVVEQEGDLAVLPTFETDAISEQISAFILDLIPDGATIQLGIGKLGSAIGYGLREKNDLGIFTEMFNEPMKDLIQNGNVTNAKKGFMDGKTVCAFAFGSMELYEFMGTRPDIYGAPFGFVNDPRNIAKNKRMISVNAAMSVNLFGEVAADSMAGRQHSGTGGQLDFVRGAQWSEGGKSFIAMPSSFEKNGVRKSKIVLDFPKLTAVTTPRSDVQYVVTEYGCVNLKILNMQDRVRAMISLAHPEFREELHEQASHYGLL